MWVYVCLSVPLRWESSFVVAVFRVVEEQPSCRWVWTPTAIAASAAEAHPWSVMWVILVRSIRSTLRVWGRAWNYYYEQETHPRCRRSYARQALRNRKTHLPVSLSTLSAHFPHERQNRSSPRPGTEPFWGVVVAFQVLSVTVLCTSIMLYPFSAASYETGVLCLRVSTWRVSRRQSI